MWSSRFWSSGAQIQIRNLAEEAIRPGVEIRWKADSKVANRVPICLPIDASGAAGSSDQSGQHSIKGVHYQRIAVACKGIAVACAAGGKGGPPPLHPGQGHSPVKGFHLTNGWLLDAAKCPNRACQDVVPLLRRPDANALHGATRRVGAFTIRPLVSLMRSEATHGRAKL